MTKRYIELFLWITLLSVTDSITCVRSLKSNLIMKIQSLLCLAFITCFLYSCRKDLVDEAQLVGKWKCVEIIEESETPPLQHINFEFNADSTYHYYSDNKNSGQKGDWYTLDDKLYTTPEGGKLMAVKLGVSGMDTVRFYQNKGGKPVVWVMVRQ